MPRTKDPTGLKPRERDGFRAVVRRAIAVGISVESIGLALEERGDAEPEKGYDRVKNALKPHRGSTTALLPRTAYPILEAVLALLSSRDDDASLAQAVEIEALLSDDSKWAWVREHLARTAFPGALLIESDIERIASACAERVTKVVFGAKSTKRPRVAAAITAQLRAMQDPLAASWFVQAQPRVAQFVKDENSVRSVLMLVRAVTASLNRRSSHS